MIPELERFFNREISWLNFNARVLEEASSPLQPVLEKVKFASIFCSNLDEFFMIRVAGKKKVVQEGIKTFDSPDMMPGKEVLEQIKQRTDELVRELYSVWQHTVLKELEENNIKILTYGSLTQKQQKALKGYFYDSVFPVLTPLAVNPTHPFPFLTNLDIYLLIHFDFDAHDLPHPPVAFVEIPSILPRLIPVPFSNESDHHFIMLEDLISEHLDALFVSGPVKEVIPVRVTRDLDITLLENEIVDLLKAIQSEIKKREQAPAVRLEVHENVSPKILSYLMSMLNLEKNDVYFISGPLGLEEMSSLYDLPRDDLKKRSFNPRIPKRLKSSQSILSLIAEQDLVVHHPYDSFYTVIEFLNAAAADPNVLAIKQTLYRTSGDSPVIQALIQAAEAGKQVAAVVELKARFDEKNNIVWAREMERAGVNVVYGFIDLKVHAKATLVVRRENDKIKRYVHLSTGNYNSQTAKIYEDIGLFTSNPEVGEDVAKLFNLMTGFNLVLSGQESFSNLTPGFKKLQVAPLDLRATTIRLIEEEIVNQRKNGNGFIRAKMNALVDRELIDKLYEASQAGVKIQLIIRGVCCLKPGVPGLSENIEIVSILDRFLEHSRIFYYFAGGERKVYLSSADWMPRNMDRRIEILFPIEDERAKERVINILGISWQDNVKARRLNSDGTYVLKQLDPNAIKIQAQEKFIELAREKGLKSIPYDQAIHTDQKQKHRTIFVDVPAEKKSKK
jgi:polyphosphate kinase